MAFSLIKYMCKHSHSCFCPACEKDIKRKINLENYVPHRVSAGSIENTPKCILPNCEATESIVYSELNIAENDTTICT